MLFYCFSSLGGGGFLIENDERRETLLLSSLGFLKSRHEGAEESSD